MNTSNRNSRIADRVAVVAILAAAVLILSTLAVTAKSAPQLMPAAMTIALSPSVSPLTRAMGDRASSEGR